MKYRLKKDLPFAKAGTEVALNYDSNIWTVRPLTTKIDCPLCDIPEDVRNEWIEEVKPREWEVILWNNEISSKDIIMSPSAHDALKYIKVREVIEWKTLRLPKALK